MTESLDTDEKPIVFLGQSEEDKKLLGHQCIKLLLNVLEGFGLIKLDYDDNKYFHFADYFSNPGFFYRKEPDLPGFGSLGSRRMCEEIIGRARYIIYCFSENGYHKLYSNHPSNMGYEVDCIRRKGEKVGQHLGLIPVYFECYAKINRFCLPERCISTWVSKDAYYDGVVVSGDVKPEDIFGKLIGKLLLRGLTIPQEMLFDIKSSCLKYIEKAKLKITIQSQVEVGTLTTTSHSKIPSIQQDMMWTALLNFIKNKKILFSKSQLIDELASIGVVAPRVQDKFSFLLQERYIIQIAGKDEYYIARERKSEIINKAYRDDADGSNNNG